MPYGIEPEALRELARQTKQQRLLSLRAIAEYYSLRSKRQISPEKREQLAEAAEHHRRLAKLEEEVGETRLKPVCKKGWSPGGWM